MRCSRISARRRTEHKAFVYAAWRPFEAARSHPSLDLAGDRWSDVNPVPAFPYSAPARIPCRWAGRAQYR